MFEAQVAFYLNKYLGQYVEDIDQRSLTISIYEGNVVLKNLRLKPEALSELDLPITVEAGLLGSLTLKVPWSALGRVPVDVTIDRLYILAAPRTEEAGCSKEDTADALITAFQQAKLKRVARQESNWIDELQELENKRLAADGKPGTDGGTDGGGGGFLRGLIDTILGNLQFSFTNVHVRYEDAVTHPGQPFACGLTLERMSGSTVDELGRPAFVNTSPLDLLRKALLLRRIAVYFDCGVTGWDPGELWEKMTPADWESWFQPGIALDGVIDSTGKSGANSRQYLLQPVDGRATYTRRGRNVRRSESEAAAEVDFALDAVTVALTQQQYHSYSLLLAEVSTFTARLPQMGYRPRERPAPGESARAWWRYAGLAVKQHLEARRLTWHQVLRFSKMRRQYVPLYVQYLNEPDVTQTTAAAGAAAAAGGVAGGGTAVVASAGAPESASTGAAVGAAGGAAAAGAAGAGGKKKELPKEIVEMDDILPEHTILMFRRLAYAEVQRERRRAAKAAAAGGRTAQPTPQSQGWLGWLMGSKAATGPGQAKPGEQPVLPPAAEDAKGQQRAELSAEEYNTLIELVSQQEEGLKLGVETPYSLLTQVTARVGSASAMLVGIGGDSIMRGSLEGISAAVDMFPVTRRVQLNVTAMGVESPEGVFLQTGAESGPMRGPVLDRASSLLGEMQAVTAEQALACSIIHRPQDNSADAVVDVVLTPSYVYYKASTVDRVVKFFTPPSELRSLDFSGLSAAATSQLERARKAAAEYAAAALSNKPRLRLKLDLEAPKVAIPVKDGQGEVSLALDLGRFVIETDPTTAASLSPEEAGLYECIRLVGSNVSAYVVDGSFDWAELGQEKAGKPSPKLVPLLDRCGMEVGLQAARYPEPKYPTLRLSPTVPVLHFHMSPGRIGRLLRVINGALPPPETGPSGAELTAESLTPAPAVGAAGGDEEGEEDDETQAEGWRARSDFEGPIKVLTWTGLGRTTASWCPRYAVLYQGKLYLYENEHANKVVSTVSVWPDRAVLPVPPENIGQCPHVLAIRPAGPAAHDLKRIAEDSSSTILRCESEDTAEEWYRSLLSSQQALQAIAGGVPAPGAAAGGSWEAASTISSSETEEVDQAAALSEKPLETARGEGPSGPSVMLQVNATLGEFAVFMSGREPTSYWPPSAPQATSLAHTRSQSTEDLSQGCTTPYALAIDAGEVDNEVALIVLRASGGSLDFEYGTFGMTVQTALGSLEILDILVGTRNPKYCFLATSSKPSAGAITVDEDVFFDPALSSQELPRSFSGISAVSSGTPRKGDAGGSGPVSPFGRQDLAEFTLKLRRPGTKEYEGVDTALEAKLNKLYFFCNRPTVAALITMGLDVSAAASAAFNREDSSADASASDGGGETPTSQSGGVVTTTIEAVEDEAEALPLEKIEGLDLLADAPGGRRTMFTLNVTLQTLQVVLNYEGASNESLAEACITDFSFGLSIAPDGAMDITSALGNLSAVDCTLPEDNPYRQACGLRPGSSASLVSLNFASHPASHAHPRVPPGFAFYTLQAKLSELQLVFLYRFLQENLQYLSIMLAMRPVVQQAQQAQQRVPAGSSPSNIGTSSPRPQGLSPRGTSSPRGELTRLESQPAQQAQQQQQPFVLAMEVEMDAPVISMPRFSNSTDAIEVDLGLLKLSTSVESTQLNGVKQSGDQAQGRVKPSSLVEVAELTFSGVGCTVVQAGRRGHSVVKNPEQGWKVGWRRPLVPIERGDAPFFDFSLDVPFIKASITDAEYLLMTSVASANVSEPPKLPIGAQWVADKYLPIIEGNAQQQQQQQALSNQPPSPTKLLLTPGLGQPSPRDEAVAPQGAPEKLLPPQQAQQQLDSIMAAMTKIRTVISLGEVELELRQSVEGLPAPIPLARFSVANLYVTYRNTEGGSMYVEACIPKVEAQDLRPEVPPEQSLAISSGHKASFLMLQWDASPGMVQQTLGLTLQKPLFVAELSFLLSVTRFVLPTFSFVKSSPIPFATHDILLGKEPLVATEDAWLSPAMRLLADGPGLTACEYDGAGHRLVLPSRDHLDELLPLILIGTGCVLRLRNVTIVNADSLAACLQLAPGAQLLAQPTDGVKMFDSTESFKSPQLSPRGRAPLQGSVSPRLGAADFGVGSVSERFTQQQLQESDQTAQIEAPNLERSIKMSVNAVGVGLQLMQLDQTRLGNHNHNNKAAAGGGGAMATGLSRAGSHYPSSQDLISPSSLAPSESQAGVSVRRASSSTLGSLPPVLVQRSIRVLAATMDLSADYENTGLVQKGHVVIQGLRAETRTIADVDKVLQSRAAEDLATHRKVRGKKETVVLQPCRIELDFHLQSEIVPSTGAPQVLLTNVDLRASELRVTLLPAVAELASSLGAGALAPLMQPGPSAPMHAVAQFERVWSVDIDSARQRDSDIAVSLSVTGASGGVTIWRPKTTTGYGITGHVITAGDANPSFEVMTVAINSGIAAYPSSFEKVWSGGGATVWRPVPPEGYVAMGDLVTVGEREPDLLEVLCLHQATVVEVPVGECLPLPAASLAGPSVALSGVEALPPIDFWCIDNTMGTFMAAASESVRKVQGRDLRSPAGLTPAALVAQGAAVPAADVTRKPSNAGSASIISSDAATQSQTMQTIISKLQLTSSPRELFEKFQASRRQKRTEEVRRTLTPAVVDFRRLWSDQGAFSMGEGVTFWRPIAPPGYVALGDCVVKGFHPPTSCLVIREEYSRDGGPQSKGALPLVRAPLEYELMWSDATQREEVRLCFWRPVPHEGYVAMGYVVSVGYRPPRKGISCVRKDAVVAAGNPRNPIWAVRGHKSIPPLSVWSIDDSLGTFVVDPTDRYNPATLEKWRLAVSDDPIGSLGSARSASGAVEATQQQPGRGGVDVIINAGSISILLLDGMQNPVVEVETGGIEAGVHGPSRQVVQAYLGLRPSVTAYNRVMRYWEPVVEPVDVIAKCDVNTGRKLSNGIEPGIFINIKSSAEMVYTTFAVSHATSILAAIDHWRQLHSQKGHAAAQLATAMSSDAATMPTTVLNALGVDAAMELDYGDRMGLAKLPSGQASLVLRPLVKYPRRKNTGLLPRESLPHDLLLVDIATATGKDLRPSQSLYCIAKLTGEGVDGTSPPSSGVGNGPRTRSLSPATDINNGAGIVEIVSWGERLVLPLPSRPAPSHRLRIEVWDSNGGGGKGILLGTSEVVVPVTELAERDAQQVDMPVTQGDASGTATAPPLCTVHASYMLQRQWISRPDSSNSCGVDSWDKEESSVGQRALSLSTYPGLWTVVPISGKARAGVATGLAQQPSMKQPSMKERKGASTASGTVEHGTAEISHASESLGYVIPLRIGNDGVVLEGRMQQGEFKELLRAPCQMINTTAFTLEACLITLKGGEWIDVGAVDVGATSSRISDRQLLGRVAPGEALPMPLGWQNHGRQLLLRPVVSSAEEEGSLPGRDSGSGSAEGEDFDALEALALHDWSVGATDGHHTLRLDDIDEGVTRLVSCKPLSFSTISGSPTAAGASSLNTQGAEATSASAAASSLWFSITVESEMITAGTKRGEPLVDWRIVIAPPLTLANQLPMPGGLIVWEHTPEAKGQAVAKLSERVPSGGRVAVHTADMRRAVSFTIYPDGYDWAEASPAVLSTGVVRSTRPPPDRFRLLRPGSRLPVEVFLQRDYQLGPWIIDSQGELDPGSVVARGVPLAVTLLAPLWVVNATGLAIDAAVVPVAPPPQPKSKDKLTRGLPAALAASVASSQLASARILRTSNVPIPGMPPPQDPPGRRTIAPVSMEILSFPLPDFIGGATTLGAQPSAAAGESSKRGGQRAQHYGVRLRVAGSGWTQPLTVNALNGSGSGRGNGDAAGTVDTLQSAEPVLIQAEARDYGVVYEVTARLEISPFKNSQVLRLEPHVVITNRTSVPLQVLQCRPAAGYPAPAPSTSHHPGSHIVPDGGRNVVPGAIRGVNALPIAPEENSPPLVRPVLRGVSDRPAAHEESIIRDSCSIDSGGSGEGGNTQLWRGLHSILPAATLVHLPHPAHQASQASGAILELPAGTVAVPLHLVQGLYRSHVLCFRYATHESTAGWDLSGGGTSSGTISTRGSSSTDKGSGTGFLWSRPISVLQDQAGEYSVFIPVSATTSKVTGSGEVGMALLRLTVHTRGPGMLHMVLESVNSEPPFLLENRTPFALHYRQAHIPAAAFHSLAPYSAVGYAWEYTVKEGSPEIEVQEGLGVGASSIYQIETATEGRARSLPLSALPHQCTVRIGYAEAVATDVSGVVAIGGEAAGSALGRGGIDRLLQIAPGRDPLMMAGLKGVAIPPPEILTTIEIPGLELSIVDNVPQEVLLLTVSELKVVMASGSTPVGPFHSLRCTVRRLQGDNQLPGSRYPVAISTARTARQTLPMLCFTMVSQVAGARGRTFFPFIGGGVPEDLQVAISEPLVWRFAAIAEQLMQAAGAGGGAAGAEEEATTAAADVPLRIRHLNFGNIGLNVSFQGDPLSRPRHLAGGIVALVIDLANFQAAPIIVHGFDRVEIVTMRSAFMSYLYQWISTELFGIALSLVRNFGVIGGASKVLSILSAGVAKLSGDQKGTATSHMTSGASSTMAPQLSSQRTITDVGDGLLEGAGAFGTSILRGFRGLVEKPMQGAKQSGVEGAMKGIAKGLVGVVANPVSGALDALSATAEGFDASLSSKARESMINMQRRRLPRVVGGDGRLTPQLRDGSDREAIIEQLGSTLLQATLLAFPQVAATEATRRAPGDPIAEAYEEHFVLPNECAAILTNRSLIVVHAPGFAQLNGAAEIGAVSAAEVGPGELQFVVRWKDVLALELRWSGHSTSGAADQYPDRVVVHRKGTPGFTEATPLARLLRCFPGTPQASQVKLVAQKVLSRYYQDPMRQDAQWAERHAARAALPADQPPDQLPLTLPSLDFIPTWHTNPARTPVVYFWRPVAPPGYHPAGDVATLGDEAPLHPVPCFRDDKTLRTAVKMAAMAINDALNGDTDTVLTAPGSSGSVKPPSPFKKGGGGLSRASAGRLGASSLPPTAPPLEYTLIWRYNGERAVSMWMPVAPQGYVALGAVVVGAPSMPSVDDYLCIREDLTAPARVFDSPIWAYDPVPASAGPPIRALVPATGRGAAEVGAAAVVAAAGYQPETWKVAAWPVDSRLGTFLVVRALSRPPAELARSVVEVEEKEATKTHNA